MSKRRKTPTSAPASEPVAPTIRIWQRPWFPAAVFALLTAVYFHEFPFSDNVILAKIRRAEFDDYAVPGDQLRYDATLDSLDERAGVTSGTILKNQRQIGRVDLIFSHGHQGQHATGWPEHNFVFTEEFLNLLASFRGDAGGGEIGY